MTRSLARTVAWILILVFVIIAGGTCSRLARIEGAGPGPEFVPIEFAQVVAGPEFVTWMYSIDPSSIKAVRYDGTCLAEDAGVWYYDADNEVRFIRGGHRSIDLDGATVYTGDKLSGGRIVAGAWFKYRYAWGGAGGSGTGGPGGHNLRRDSLPMGAMHDDGGWEWPWVVQCVGGPYLPLVTSGPADIGYFIVIGICLALLWALNSNKRPQPPHR